LVGVYHSENADINLLLLNKSNRKYQTAQNQIYIVCSNKVV